ncbi:O-antigen ligase family protein [Bacillus mycoides]|uniref:O-antigen ligase family protein n=1 Tax=Bacillus mycoides TaxID=1405 RepID=UPI003D64C262
MSSSTLRKNFSFLLLLMLVLPQVLPFKVCYFMSVGYLAFNFLFYKVPITRKILFCILPLVFILCTGVIAGVYSFSNNFTDSIKDIVYMTAPILYILVGFIQMLKIKDIRVALKTIVIAGGILSIIHISKLIANPWVVTESVRVIRQQLGNGYTLSIIGLVIIYFTKYYDFRVFERRTIGILFFFLCTFSFLISLSRTLTLILFIFIIVMGWIKMKGNNLKLGTSYLKIAVSLYAIIAIGIVSYLLVSTQSHVINQIGQKFYTSLVEIKVNDYTNVVDINNNWRGYEGYRALIEYENYNIVEKAIGGGIGKLIDLNLKMVLDGKEYYKVPVIHNGYIYILVKTGIIGFLMYLYFTLNVIKDGFKFQKGIHGIDKLVGRLMMALGVSLLIITYFNTGLYETEGSSEYVILLGVLQGYMFLANKGKKTEDYTI